MEPTQSTVTDTPRDRGRRGPSDAPPWAWPLLALLVLVGGILVIEYYQQIHAGGGPRPDRVFGWSTFLKPQNLLNVLNQQSYVGVVAVGMTFVIVSGGIDLSVGSLLALLAAVGLTVANAVSYAAPAGGQPGVVRLEWLGVPLGYAAMLAAGAAAGLLHGLLISKGRIAPFIATLGGLAAYRSLALTLARSGEIVYAGGRGELFAALGNNGIPIPGTDLAGPFADRAVPATLNWSILIWLAVAAGGWVVLNRSVLGRYTLAVGSNEQASAYNAVPVARVRVYVYMLMGVLTGLAAMLFASRINSVSSGGSGTLLELDAIAAVVVGGTRLGGGRGTIAGTVIGVLILGVISNMLTLLGISDTLQGTVKGVVIVAAVLIQRKA